MARGNPHAYVALANFDIGDPSFAPPSGRPSLPSFVGTARDAVPPADGDLPKQWSYAIKKYTRGSRGLNEYLASRHHGKVEERQNMDRWAERLCKALRFLYFQAPSGVTQLWRGCQMYERQVSWYKKRFKRIVGFSSFTSCSSSKRVAERFAAGEYGGLCHHKVKVLFEIRRDPRWPTCAHISNHADEQYTWEEESLFIPGSRFVVLSVTENDDDGYNIVLKENKLQAHLGRLVDDTTTTSEDVTTSNDATATEESCSTTEELTARSKSSDTSTTSEEPAARSGSEETTSTSTTSSSDDEPSSRGTRVIIAASASKLPRRRIDELGYITLGWCRDKIDVRWKDMWRTIRAQCVEADLLSNLRKVHNYSCKKALVKGYMEAFDVLLDRSHWTDNVLHEAALQRAHRALMSSSGGAYRTTLARCGQVYFLKPRLVHSAMQEFFGGMDRVLRCGDLCVYGKAAWVLVHFMFIHPFPDGNGRMGRLLANAVLRRSRYPFFLDLSHPRSDYIAAVKASQGEEDGATYAMAAHVRHCAERVQQVYSNAIENGWVPERELVNVAASARHASGDSDLVEDTTTTTTTTSVSARPRKGRSSSRCRRRRRSASRRRRFPSSSSSS